MASDCHSHKIMGDEIMGRFIKKVKKDNYTGSYHQDITFGDVKMTPNVRKKKLKM